MRTRIFVVCAFFALCGCSQHHPIRGSSGEEPFNNGTVIWNTRNDRVWIVVWYDIAAKNTSQFTGTWDGNTSTGSEHLRRRHVGTDGRKLEMWATTSDGKTGFVEINGIRFKLEDGPLFLVTTRGERTGTVQVYENLTDFQPTPESLKKLSSSIPAIRQYLEMLEAAL